MPTTHTSKSRQKKGSIFGVGDYYDLTTVAELSPYLGYYFAAIKSAFRTAPTNRA